MWALVDLCVFSRLFTSLWNLFDNFTTSYPWYQVGSRRKKETFLDASFPSLTVKVLSVKDWSIKEWAETK